MRRTLHLSVVLFAVLATTSFPPSTLDFRRSHIAGASLCDQIASALPGRVFYSSSDGYNSSQSAYYTSFERNLAPACTVRPCNTSDVSRVVTLVSTARTNSNGPQLAFRSGGHSFFSGAANIDDGVTLDLRSLNSFSLSADHKTASVGGGSIWSSDVYPNLDSYNLTVAGARVPGIGVGGFVTGGGLNFLERRNGFACDNIYGYEVVLGTGEVVYAAADRNRDLWLALKGGTNNFGIITRFDLAAYPQGDMLGGFVAYNATPQVLSEHAEAFSKFMEPANFDPLAVVELDLYYTSGGVWSISDALFYVDPVAEPAVFQDFMNIPNQTLYDLGIRNTTTVVEEAGKLLPDQVGRAIQVSYSLTGNGNASVYNDMFSNFIAAAPTFQQLDGLILLFLLQALPVTNGTNSLGLEPNATDKVLVNMSVGYDNATDDPAALAALEELLRQQLEIAASAGLLSNFTYLNYAGSNQRPLETYGTIGALQQVSKKYDPNAFFQMAVPGPWKLFD